VVVVVPFSLTNRDPSQEVMGLLVVVGKVLACERVLVLRERRPRLRQLDDLQEDL
jgi:hypothetical protein